MENLEIDEAMSDFQAKNWVAVLNYKGKLKYHLYWDGDYYIYGREIQSPLKSFAKLLALVIWPRAIPDFSYYEAE